MKTNFYHVIFIISFAAFFLIRCGTEADQILVSGVTEKNAQKRVKLLTDAAYDLRFRIPEKKTASIDGQIIVSFKVIDKIDDVVMDFTADKKQIKKITIEEKEIDYVFENDHIIIPEKYIKRGLNSIKIIFTAGDGSLNRNTDFLYSLFVPDRASTCFPCFDQPDLKARFTLALDIPVGWTASSNAGETENSITQNRKVVKFAQSEPLSTYLFAFTAGRFETVNYEIDGRKYRLLHRETDTVKTKKNLPEIFRLAHRSVLWLEQYTDIKMPFSKYDLVAIPSFQYGGMEHPGTIIYRASRIFLDDNATQKQILARAGLIAHETAHLWFGDMVTMKWFNEVWLKEVFANYMADKIIRPEFPQIDHDLQFILAHYPPAYEIDRSQGANPIQQKLDNLKNAGTLYGNIIYHKAPIVMAKLEQLIGSDALQNGVKEYLKQYAYSNAAWSNLIDILSKKSKHNLREWSRVWVEEAGMPEYSVAAAPMPHLQQSDPSNKNRVWLQNLDVIYRNKIYTLHNSSKNTTFVFNFKPGEMLLINSSGMGYGYFKFDKKWQENAFAAIDTLKQPSARISIWMNLFENTVRGNYSATEMTAKLQQGIFTEKNDLILNQLLGYYSVLYRKILSVDERKKANTAEFEQKMWEKLNNAPASQKRDILSFLCNLTLQNESSEKLYRLWNKTLTIKDLKLSDDDYTDLACALSVRNHPLADSVIRAQLAQITNNDKKERFRYLIPALSANDAVRNNFFKSLKIEVNREHETWTETALQYINHPLRADKSVENIKPGLELLQEIQKTGDIFFPKMWLDAILYGHSSIEAKKSVESFLAANPDYPEILKAKILQSADLLLRK